MFSEGRDVNDQERARRPSTSTTDKNIDEVKKIRLAKLSHSTELGALFSVLACAAASIGMNEF